MSNFLRTLQCNISSRPEPYYASPILLELFGRLDNQNLEYLPRALENLEAYKLLYLIPCGDQRADRKQDHLKANQED